MLSDSNQVQNANLQINKAQFIAKIKRNVKTYSVEIKINSNLFKSDDMVSTLLDPLVEANTSTFLSQAELSTIKRQFLAALTKLNNDFSPYMFMAPLLLTEFSQIFERLLSQEVSARSQFLLQEARIATPMLFSNRHISNIRTNPNPPVFDNNASQALLNACAAGNVPGIEAALAQNANVNEVLPVAGGSCTGLQLAILYDRPDAVNFLLQQPTLDGSNRNVDGKTALQLALDHNRPQMAQAISGLAINQRLLNAAASGVLREVQDALVGGADANTINPVANGAYSALQLAVLFGRRAVIGLLIAEGADLEYRGNKDNKNTTELVNDLVLNNPQNPDFVDIQDIINTVKQQRTVPNRK